MYIHVHIVLTRVPSRRLRRAGTRMKWKEGGRGTAVGWHSHDIAITDIVWCMAYKGGVSRRVYIAQWSRKSNAIGKAFQVGEGIKG